MGQLAKIEHKQKMRRIQSGIRAAQDAGKWTGRPPLGFSVDDGYLRVNPEEFLRVREAVERVVAGEQTVDVADDLGLPQSSLSRVASERRELYLRGDADDDRLDAAVEEIEPLPDPPESQQSFEERVQQVVEDMGL
jgi:DNA invertase Pin-like site-specific DNA recombinase